MNFLKWKREILFLIPSITGGGTSSLFFTNSNHRNGELTWKKVKSIDTFLQSVGINSESEFSTSNLLKEASNYSSIIPILTKALSVQVAKKIFNGKLYKGTKYESNIGKLYPKILAAQKQKIEHQLKNLSKSKKRIKKNWTHDEKKYFDNLKDYVLSRIDEKNVQEYFSIDPDSHLFKGKNIQHNTSSKSSKDNLSNSITPLLGFLMGVWIENHKAGYYVHQVIPYSENFSPATKNFYEQKYKDIRLPSKPDYFFPDYKEKARDNNENLFKEYIDEWFKGKKNYENWYSLSPIDRSLEIKNNAKIEWISSKNNTHKNIALRYLTESDGQSEPQKKDSNNGGRKHLASWYNALSSLLLRHKKKHDCDISQSTESQSSSNIATMQSFSTFWGELKYNPLNIFCINNLGKSQPDFMMFAPDKHSHKAENLVSSKIIFYRDEKGFNLLYPVNRKIIDTAKNKEKQDEEQKDPGEFESLIKNSDLISEFKKYIQENFSFLLLKYHSFIRQKTSKKNGKSPETCSCDELINKLIELIELSKKLRDWDSIWKFYDIRKVNNTVLTASTTGKNNYLNKMGTADINPPNFLQSRINKDLPKLRELQKTVEEYVQKASQYLDGVGTQSSENNKSFEFKKSTDSKGNNYWVIEQKGQSSKSKDETCMKKEVLQYLLESIFTQQLINKYLKIPLIFESAGDLFKKKNSQSGVKSRKKREAQTSNNSSWIEKILQEKWKVYLNSESNGQKLENLLLEKIKKADILSRISNLSDTTLHHLTQNISSENKEKIESSTTSNEFNKWDNIESFISLTNLDDSKNLLDEQLKIFITSLYLMENSFEEYREKIRKIIKDEGFGVYAFTLSWNKFCTVDSFLIDPIQKVEIESFWTPLQNQKENKDKEWDKNNTDPRQCIKTSDRMATSTLKKKFSQSNPAKVLLNFFISLVESITSESNLKEEQLMGFKGLISSEDISKLPEEFYYKIFSFLHREGHINWNDIEAQINNLKTNHHLIEYIKKINNISPSIGKTFELSDVRRKPESTDEAKVVDTMDWFNLEERKKLLIKFIKENLLSTQPAQQKRFRGLLFEKEKSALKQSYIFDKNENSSIAYLIQITPDDLKDDDSFLKFVQDHLTPESLIQDVVKQAKNKALQMKAINNFLARGQWINGKKVFDLRSGDYFLKNQFSSIVTV